MKETIYTIPISEAFDKKSGCPLCTLYGDLERASLEYITGAAMMEPAVRIETNKLGFCAGHFHDMLKLQNRLSVGLVLESHLEEIHKLCFQEPGLFGGGSPERAAATTSEAAKSCFVCSRIETFMGHYYRNILYMWKTSLDFRHLFAAQPVYCLPHLSCMLEYAKRELSKKEARDFTSSSLAVSRAYLTSLREELSAFNKSFDYRSADTPLTENQKHSIENSIGFLTSYSKNH